MSKKPYIHYLSVLKCAGMVAVILIHVICTPFESSWSYCSSVESFLSYFLANALRAWAVPVFVMVSGALFLNSAREISLRKLYGTYILRLVLVLASFGTVFALMEIVFTERTFELKFILDAVRNVYAGKLWDHLWFVYMIMGLYIATPPLRTMIRGMERADILYFLAVLLAFSCAVPFAVSLTGVEFGVYIPFCGIWLFYYVLGYALHSDLLRISVPASVLLIASGIAWCALGQLVPGTRIPHGAALKYADPGGICGVLMAAGIFSLAKQRCASKIGWADSIVPLSFGVYIVHAVFINFMYKVALSLPVRSHILLVWLTVFAVTAASSLLSVWLLRKISFIRRHIL